MYNGIMTSFRLKPKTLKQLNEISKLWGVNKTRTLEIMIDTFANTSLDIKVKPNETKIL